MGWVTTRLVPGDVLAPVSPAHDVAHGAGLTEFAQQAPGAADPDAVAPALEGGGMCVVD